MDEGHEPERIEIELTSHDPAAATGRSRRARSGPAGGDVASGEPADGDGPGLLGTERGRLLAVGVTAALIALLVGVLIGRVGSGEVESVDDTPSTSAEVTTTTRPTGDRDTLPSAPSVLSPTTTRPERATTTTISGEEWVVGSIAINREASREEAEVIAVTGRGVLTRVDAITGATISINAGGGFGQPFVSAGDGWVLVSDDRGGFTSIADDGTRATLELGGWWPPLTAGAAVAWRAEFDQESGQPTRLVEVSLDGSETGNVIDVAGYYPAMIDPLGGVVVQASGGYYVVTPDSRSRVTTGQLHALGERRALVHECDDRLECGYFVIDRVSGAREPLEIDTGSTEPLQFGGLGWWGIGDPLSPNEEALVVASWDNGGQALGVIDLLTGSYQELGRFQNEPQAAWSPSSRYLYWLDGGKIMIFDRSTGESVLFSEDLDNVVAVAVRPVARTTDGG